MKKTIFSLFLAGLMLSSGTFAFTEGECCSQRQCECMQEECCEDGQCTCKGECCKSAECNCKKNCNCIKE